MADKSAPIIRGDVVVVVTPQNTKPLVKRIVGMPGDQVEVRKNRVVINGVPAEYKLAGEFEFGDPTVTVQGIRYLEQFEGRSHFVLFRYGLDGPLVKLPSGDYGPVIVPEGSLFLLGDNRDYSNDSRYWGFASQDKVIGKPLYLFWPPERFGTRFQ